MENNEFEIPNISVVPSKAQWVFLGASALVTVAGIAADYYIHTLKLKKTAQFIEEHPDTNPNPPTKILP